MKAQSRYGSLREKDSDVADTRPAASIYCRNVEIFPLSQVAVCPPFRFPFLFFLRRQIRYSETRAKLIFIYERGSGARFVCLGWKYIHSRVARKARIGRKKRRMHTRIAFREKLRAPLDRYTRENFRRAQAKSHVSLLLLYVFERRYGRRSAAVARRIYGANKTATSSEVTVTVFSTL